MLLDIQDSSFVIHNIVFCIFNRIQSTICQVVTMLTMGLVCVLFQALCYTSKV
jgi:hypothetical protein